jgi:hypothetical protein
VHWRETNALGCPVDRLELYRSVFKVMGTRMQQVVQLLLVAISGAGRQPMMSQITIKIAKPIRTP